MPTGDPFSLQTWRIDMRTRTLKREPFPQSWERLGGRGLSARILLDEIEPTCEPLGPSNKLVFAPGLLVGHMLSSTDRISIGGKSPLTGGIKEANAGGRTGLQMTHLGIKALIIEGQPAEPGYWVLFLDASGARFEPAADLVGLGVYETATRLIERYGEKAAIALIGPGAEMKLRASGIQNLDRDRVPSRIAARGGLGAVMAVKGLKAIVFDGASGQKPPLVDPEAFRKAQKEFTQALMAHPQIAIYKNYGTAGMTRMTQAFGALPTRNFSSGQFEGAEEISGEHLRDVLLERGGDSNPSHACMPGCTIQCSNIFADENGKMSVSPLEYETISLMGSNLGISDLDMIARLNWEVNDLGLDSIEVGAALGVASEAGLAKFGDGARYLELLNEIRQGTPLGRVIGSGAGTVGSGLRHRARPGRQKPGLLGLRAAFDQRHRCHLRHLPDGRRPHCRSYHPSQDRPPRSKDPGWLLAHRPDQHGRIRHAGRLYLCRQRLCRRAQFYLRPAQRPLRLGYTH